MRRFITTLGATALTACTGINVQTPRIPYEATNHQYNNPVYQELAPEQDKKIELLRTILPQSLFAIALTQELGLQIFGQQLYLTPIHNGIGLTIKF